MLRWFKTSIGLPGFSTSIRSDQIFSYLPSTRPFVVCGVLHGPVLGPVLMLCTDDLLSVTEGHGLHPQLLQLQLQLQLQSFTLQQIVLRGIMQCCRLVGTDVFSLDRNCWRLMCGERRSGGSAFQTTGAAIEKLRWPMDVFARETNFMLTMRRIADLRFLTTVGISGPTRGVSLRILTVSRHGHVHLQLNPARTAAVM